MAYHVPALQNLIDKFASLPGIGRKSAQRIAFHVLNLPDDAIKSFSDAPVERPFSSKEALITPK